MLPSFRYYRFRRTTLISLGCGAFLVGLGLAKIGWLVDAWWLAGSLLFVPFLLGRKVWAIMAVVVIGLLLGVWRGGLALQDLHAYAPLFDKKVSLHGVIANDPTYGKKGEQVFLISGVKQGEQVLPGQVRVTTFSILDVKRGDTVNVSGKLRDGFGNYQASLYFAELKQATSGQNLIDDARYAFAAGTYNALPEPQASLGLGFLIGLRSQLPENLDDQLRAVGLTHIVVASGYNLTILVRAARRLFEKRSKYQTIVVSGSLIAGFVIVTGFSPSMTRAALVTGLALAAWYYGRRIHPVVLLLVAAAITTAVNPLYLWTDIGWWLSFLAFAGILILAPLLQRRIFGKRKPKLLGQVIIETLSAQILTLPLILMIFGQLSILSLPANLLIVPLIPLAMLCTFAAGIVGIFAPLAASYVALPAVWLLTFITELVKWLAQVPWASVPFSFALPIMVISYAAIAIIGFMLWRKTKFNFLRSSVIE